MSIIWFIFIACLFVWFEEPEHKRNRERRDGGADGAGGAGGGGGALDDAVGVEMASLTSGEGASGRGGGGYDPLPTEDAGTDFGLPTDTVKPTEFQQGRSSTDPTRSVGHNGSFGNPNGNRTISAGSGEAGGGDEEGGDGGGDEGGGGGGGDEGGGDGDGDSDSEWPSTVMDEILYGTGPRGDSHGSGKRVQR